MYIYLISLIRFHPLELELASLVYGHGNEDHLPDHMTFFSSKPYQVTPLVLSEFVLDNHNFKKAISSQ